MKILRVFFLLLVLTTNFHVLPDAFADFKTFDRIQKREVNYVGSKMSDKYHDPNCSAARKIKPDNYIGFYDVKQAREAGYFPCKLCKPPVRD